MQERHTDRKQYFLEQGITTKKYVIPYISEINLITEKTRLLEVGCGEGGNLGPFIEMGCEVIGIDLSKSQINNAKDFINEHYQNPTSTLINENIYNISPADIGRFDVIMLRDVIEHIPDQDKFLGHIKQFLNPNGVIFFGFPPWHMPFGGHQQICQNKIVSKLPYFHILPTILYRGILRLFGESEDMINVLIEIKETGIGINKFQRLIKKNKYKFEKKTFYLINPNYEIKFQLKLREQFRIIARIPYLRDFLTTCVYCVVKNNDSKV